MFGLVGHHGGVVLAAHFFLQMLIGVDFARYRRLERRID